MKSDQQIYYCGPEDRVFCKLYQADAGANRFLTPHSNPFAVFVYLLFYGRHPCNLAPLYRQDIGPVDESTLEG